MDDTPTLAQLEASDESAVLQSPGTAAEGSVGQADPEARQEDPGAGHPAAPRRAPRAPRARRPAYAERKVRPIVPLAEQGRADTQAILLIRQLEARQEVLATTIDRLKHSADLTKECLRCGHKWTSYLAEPRVCPRCHSGYWDKPPKKANARRPGDPPNPNWARWQDRQRRVPLVAPQPPAMHVVPSAHVGPDAFTRDDVCGMPPPPPPPGIGMPRSVRPTPLHLARWGDEPQPEHSARTHEINAAASRGADTREVDVAQTAEPVATPAISQEPLAETQAPVVTEAAGSIPAIDRTLARTPEPGPDIADTVIETVEEFKVRRAKALKEALGE
jgi:hypothetical protein